MTELFRNKYRIPSNRLRGWNYANNGHYFITIVTYNHIQHFGEIHNGNLILNNLGNIIVEEFLKSFEMRQELYLGNFIVMPNHLHAIVNIFNDKSQNLDVNTLISPTKNIETCETINFEMQNTLILERQSKSISSFISGFKSATINRIDNWIDTNHLPMDKFNRNNPLWQKNYHDHIIRTENEYQRISNYITMNPKNWGKSKRNKKS